MKNARDLSIAAAAALFLTALVAVFLGAKLLFAAALLGGVACTMRLGIVGGPRGRALRGFSVAVSVAVAAVPIAAVVLDASGAAPAERWLGMLPATAVVVLGLPLVPLVLLGAFVVLFPRAIYGKSEHERFLRLGAWRAESDEAASEASAQRSDDTIE